MCKSKCDCETELIPHSKTFRLLTARNSKSGGVHEDEMTQISWKYCRIPEVFPILCAIGIRRAANTHGRDV